MYTLIGHKDRNMLTKHDWSTLGKVWPSVLLSRHSEKPSIAKLLDRTCHALQRYSETFSIENHVSEKAIQLATKIIPQDQRPTSDTTDKKNSDLKAQNAENAQQYEKLVNSLCESLEKEKLHWRHYNLGLAMLTTLTRHDVDLPTRAVKLMVENLIHENVLVRNCAIHVIGSILKQHKRPHPKVEITVSNSF